MTDNGFRRLGAWAALLVALSSVLYAIAFLVVTPSAQRGDDVGEFFRSYADDPTGRRLANILFIVGGIAGAVATAALAERLRVTSEVWSRWLATVGIVANLAGMAHGLWNLIRIEELSTLYANEADRGAVEVVYRQPSPVDPEGLFRFAVGGLVVLGFGLLIRRTGTLPPRLGWLGAALGVDMLLLFATSWAGAGGPVVITGALASLALLPAFWVWVGIILLRERPAGLAARAAGADPAAVGGRLPPYQPSGS